MTLEKYKTPNFDKIEKIDDAGRMDIKGYNIPEIAQKLHISPQTAQSYVKEYQAYMERKVEEDPYFLEKIQLNTLKTLSEIDEVSKELWETLDIATREGMVGTRVQVLKAVIDAIKVKGGLHGLLGGNANDDADLIARMQKHESVNSILSRIISDITSECDICRPKARTMLKEAFALLETEGFKSAEEAHDALDHDYSLESEEL